MADYLLLFVGTVLVNNFVLVKFLGLCPFMGVSKKLEAAMGMGLATTFVMTLASICAWLIDTWILIPLDLVYLRTLAFILDGFAAAVGFSLVMVLFASIRERLVVADVPAPFRGNAIALVTAGLMSLAFMGFSGLVKL